MPKNQFQRTVFALLTVIVTVHAYVFFSLYVLHGESFIELTGESSVSAAINAMGGIYMLGRNLPVWALVMIEFILAFSLELLVGSPCSFALASRVFNPKETHPVIFESAIISATVGIMCPAMSFIASILYYPYRNGFSLITLIAQWLKLMCFNFPFAFFTQLFFIQPFIRTIYRFLFRKSLAEG